jgi:hypothetical protein
MEEIWKDIAGYEGVYKVSNYGNVYSFKSNKNLSHSYNTYGYAHVGLVKNGKHKVVMVHRLLAIAFIPNPNNLPVINHKDGNKLNNSIDNLEWCTRAYNNRHARENGLHRGGGLKKPIVAIIGNEIVKEYSSGVEASKDGYNPSSISSCINGKSKAHKGFIWRAKNTG